MSFSTTALQLVNRVNRRRHQPDVASFNETEDLATVDSLNRAIEEVLSSKRWEFDTRRAQLKLRKRETGGFTQTTTGSEDVQYLRGDLVAGDTAGDFIARLILTGSAVTPETAFRALSTSGSIVAGITGFTMAAEMQEDATFAGGTSLATTIMYAEYVLPDTVKNIARVTYQEYPLTLDQVDSSLEFDEIYPRPSIEFGTPEIVSVGGFDIPTYNALTYPDAPPPPQLRMAVWPVPDDDYVLDYTYTYRHPELSATTDLLEGVPPNVVDMIVDIAASDMKAYYEKDYEALSLRSDARRALDEMHRRHGGMSADRRPVGNWDGTAAKFRRHGSMTRGRLIGQ